MLRSRDKGWYVSLAWFIFGIILLLISLSKFDRNGGTSEDVTEQCAMHAKVYAIETRLDDGQCFQRINGDVWQRVDVDDLRVFKNEEPR